ncbi:TlpA disulfide reductase family protein [Olleya sp. AS48]|uniref:TlpA disulfide reductase family protein n=1 Tax=Olleya sp. AS48 TaxID=3135774 RepID=UPI00317F0E33
MNKKILFLFAILPTFLMAQNTIKGTFTPADQFKFAFLYQVTADTSIFVDNADIAADGSFIFNLKKTQAPGTYRIVYAQPQDEYNFDFLYNNEDIELTFDLEKGLEFVTSEENKLWISYNNSMSMIGQSLNAFYSSGGKKEKDFKNIIDILKTTQSEFEKASEGKLVLNFITASQPYIPEYLIDAKTFTENAKTSYFKHINFGNPVLQNSNFLIEATLNYVFNFSDSNDQITSYKNNIDTVVKAIGNNPKIKKVMLEILWNQFALEEVEPVANHITDTHLLALSKAENDTQLIEDLTYFKNASVGNIGQDFEIVIYDEEGEATVKNLYQLDESNNYLIVFWSTTCSHCLEEIPELRKYVKTLDNKQLKVIAIALDEDRYRWKDMTYDYPEFYHVFGEGKWDNEIGNNYNVKSTPSYFVLDSDKKIIKKPYDFKAFEAYFKTLPQPKKEE